MAPEINGQIGDTYNYYQQTYPDSCAIMSQKFILDQFGITNEYGELYSEDELVQYAYENGYYQPGEGTVLLNVGNILADANIPHTLSIDNSIFDLTRELAQGHKVIIGVDADELWNKSVWQWLKDFFGFEEANHALVVAGIDTSDPNNIMVIVDDPGSGEFHKAYPLDQFVDAWKDANCFMCSTDIPVPNGDPTMVNFDYAEMHIPSVAGVDYNTFELFCAMDESFQTSWDNMTHYNSIESLYGSFHQVAHGQDFLSAINNRDYLNYIQNDVLLDILQDTAYSGFTNLDYVPATWHNALYSDIGTDMLSLQTYYNDISNQLYMQDQLDTASYFHQQADAIGLMDMVNTNDFNAVEFYNFI